MDNYKARMMNAKTRYELEMIINELCNELCIIIEFINIRYYQILMTKIEFERNQTHKSYHINDLVDYLVEYSGLEFNEGDE